MSRRLRELAAATGMPIDTVTENVRPVESANAAKAAYEAGKAMAKQNNMSAMERIVFIEGFRAGLMEELIK